MHPGGDGRAVGAVLERADREQLDHAAHLGGRGDVARGHLGDALAVDVGGGDPGVEGEAGQDRGLRGGVEALDVGGRVGLGVPELLGLLERLVEAGAGGVHPVEDEVGGAVDDAEHAGDLVTGERLAQRPQDRDGAGDGRLVVEVATRPSRRPRTGCCRPRRAAPCWPRRRWRRARARRGSACGPARCRRSPRRRRRCRSRATSASASVVNRCSGRSTSRGDAEAAYGDAGQLDGRADARGEVAGLLVQQPGDLGADDAAAEQGHLTARLLLVHRGHPRIRDQCFHSRFGGRRRGRWPAGRPASPGVRRPATRRP